MRLVEQHYRVNILREDLFIASIEFQENKNKHIEVKVLLREIKINRENLYMNLFMLSLPKIEVKSQAQGLFVTLTNDIFTIVAFLLLYKLCNSLLHGNITLIKRVLMKA